jgi:PAS domain S-box-containing protein
LPDRQVRSRACGNELFSPLPEKPVNPRSETRLDWLLNPSARISDPERIQRARLLSAVLLVLLALGLVIIGLVLRADPEDIGDPTLQAAMGLLAVCAAMYILNRVGYTTAAAIGLIAPIIALFIFIPFFSGSSPNFLAFLVIPILLTAIFFSLRWTVIVSTGLLVVTFVLMSRLDQVSETSPFWTLRSMWYLLVLGTGLIVTFMWHAQALEAIRQRKLKHVNEQLRALVENTPDFILEINREGDILFINRERERYAAKNVREVLPPDQLELVLGLIDQSFRSGHPQAIELQGRTAEGAPTWNSVRTGPIKDGESVTSLTVIATEITAQKEAQEKIRQINAELEQRVHERTQALEAMNQELETFSYTVSHDLRAPLRAIENYTRFVLDDFSKDLSTEGQGFLQRVRESAVKMNTLIDEILMFSRVGRRQMQIASVDPGEIAREVYAELLEAGGDERHIEFSVGPMPQVQADATLLRQVYANLLENAIKYTRQRPDASIRVGCEQDSGANVFYVGDNGAGFDMKYADQLFGVFQRLHSEDEFEGTGIGLATVERIIRRHGGRIWAEAEVDQGATFRFTLG